MGATPTPDTKGSSILPLNEEGIGEILYDLESNGETVAKMKVTFSEKEIIEVVETDVVNPINDIFEYMDAAWEAAKIINEMLNYAGDES